ncbi:MAG: Gfo/Idh/MocA family oxidoreductase [Bacteroidales bacterium]|nr:Gfo/Idh/MocA family oxidoreductase [Bacteroidales bacterium]
MEKNRRKNISRRGFISSAAVSAAGLTMLSTMSSVRTILGADLKLGFIGIGDQGFSLLNGFLDLPGIRVVAGCDISDINLLRFSQRVNSFYENSGGKQGVYICRNYEELLSRPDIDAVVIAVPDNFHVQIAIAACKAGKDVYLETPLSFTFAEGKELQRVVLDTNRILAVGNQLRFHPAYRHAVHLVKSGSLGRIAKVHARWHLNRRMGEGFDSSMAADLIDVAQWGLGMESGGPCRVSFSEEINYNFEPKNINSLLMFGYNQTTAINRQSFQYEYGDGTLLVSEPADDRDKEGLRFTGEKGYIEIINNKLFASEMRFLSMGEAGHDINVGRKGILTNFIDSVRERKDPAVSVETGHRSCTVFHLGNIAASLKRTLEWDPSGERFITDTDGEATLKLQHRNYIS